MQLWQSIRKYPEQTRTPRRMSQPTLGAAHVVWFVGAAPCLVRAASDRRRRPHASYDILFRAPALRKHGPHVLKRRAPAMRCVRGAGAATAAPLRCQRHVARRATPRSAVRRAGARALVAPRAARAAFSASADSGGVPAQPQLAAEALDAALDADVTNSPDGGWCGARQHASALQVSADAPAPCVRPAASAPAGPMMPRLFSRAEPVTLETLQQCFPLVRMDKFQARAERLPRRASVAADARVAACAETRAAGGAGGQVGRRQRADGQRQDAGG
jgi:hypothetical protein